MRLSTIVRSFSMNASKWPESIPVSSALEELIFRERSPSPSEISFTAITRPITGLVIMLAVYRRISIIATRTKIPMTMTWSTSARIPALIC